MTTIAIKQWQDKILQDLKHHQDHCGEIRSIFIGGGTPSILPIPVLAELLETIRQYVQISSDCEITCESNPDSLTKEIIFSLAQAGVTRLSIGVQSFFADKRQILGRWADPQGLAEKIQYARDKGIKQINIDLIYAIPGQTLADWEQDLRQACEMGVSHLSAYALTFEEGTALAQERLCPPTEEEQIEMWHKIAEVTAEFGLYRYEISNYAKPKCQCRHNFEIWHGQTYLGLGPSAASFDGKMRFSQVADLSRWLQGESPELDPLSAEERTAEILAFGMRTVAGWDLDEFFQLTHFYAEELRGEAIRRLCNMGLLEVKGRHLFCTKQGFLLNNQVLIELL